MKGWAASKDLTTGAGVNGRFRGLVVQAKLQNPDSVTTQFNMNGSPANCRARITSLVNGQAIVRVLTVVDGSAITTRGQNINVELGDFTDSNISNNQPYTISILSTLGIRASFKNPPFLTPLQFNYTANALQAYTGSILLPDTAASCDVAVPQDCGVNSVYVALGAVDGAIPVLPGAVQVSHQSPLGTATPYDPRDYDWVPLNPNTTSIFINNDIPGTLARVSVYFGIDG